jgi:hypothetical protein
MYHVAHHQLIAGRLYHVADLQLNCRIALSIC